jgi:hypothetical protein
MCVRIVFAGVVLLASAGVALAQGDGPRISRARTAIERSLPFIEKDGVAWMKERGCVTCHQTTFLIWTHSEARRRGFDIDLEKLNAWTNWALLRVVAGLDSDSDQGADTLSQLLLGRDPSSPWFDKPAKWHGRTADPFENVTKHLLKAQTPDGNWVAGGQSGNPSELPTAWAVLALASRDEFMNARFPKRETSAPIQRLVGPNDKAISMVRDKALKWLRSQDPKQTAHLTEGLVTRLLVERKFGNADDASEQVRVLLSRQNEDGGWSADIALSQPSDAFATGQATYAISLAGQRDEQEKAAVERAIEFLVQTQEKNGSWHVPKRAFSPSSGDPDPVDEVYTYWGTAWATLGLLHTLPLPNSPNLHAAGVD